MKPTVTTFMFLITLLVLSSMTLFAQAPVNDECTGAVNVTSLPFSYSENTRTATHNISDPVLDCADGGGGKTVWFKFTPATTLFYTISTRNSTPADYDIAMGLYTGACNNLSLVDCNDDILPGTSRQAEVSDTLYAGVTYYIHVAEWKGGGPSGGTPTGGDLVFEVFQDTLKALYKGPFAGSVASGAITNTGAVMNLRPGDKENKEIENNPEVPLIQTKNGVIKATGKAGSNLYRDDMSRTGAQSISQPVALQNFKSMNSTGFIPPDGNCAVGPNHVISIANSTFRIYTKDGTMLHEITLDSWFSNVRSPVGFSDPQVLYDHYAHRWIMGGGGFSVPYSFLISVSDDDDPNGSWTNWSLPAGIGDSVTNNLPDYPQIGFDEQAIYITSREYNPGFLFSRIRIVPKAQLYAGGTGAVNWFDLYDLREPDHRTVKLDGIRPSYMFGAPGIHFFVNTSPYNPGSFITLWTLTNPITTPVLTGKNIPVVEFYGAPNADQKDGSTNLFESGGSQIRHKAIYRDSSLWVAHSIAKDSGSIYSAVRYIRLNPFTGAVSEDAALGLDGYWHFYPALMVDGNKNIVITYSMSSTNDYAGVWMTGRKNTDPAGLSPSIMVKSGDGHYEVFGSDLRNRWGDYSGAGLDPVDSLSIWITAEYASATNVWGLWTARTKLSPVEGKYLYANNLSHTFSIQEVGTTSNGYDVMLRNFGSDPVQINSITQPSANFSLPNLPALPVTIALGDTLIFHVAFTPQDTGALSTVVTITSDDVDRSPMTFNATGTAFHIIAAQPHTMYASSGTIDGGKIYTVNPLTGDLSLLGNSGYGQVLDLRVHPSTKELYALVPSGTGALIARVNSERGDAHPTAVFINQTFLKGMEFLNDSTVYVGKINGKIYTVNLRTGVSTEVASTGLLIAGLALDPVTHQLWVSSRNTSNSDRMYKVSMPSGTSTIVGSTGFGQQTTDIAFDANGNLYGLIGSSSQTNRLILIDTLTGAGTLVGSMARSSMQGIALSTQSLVAGKYLYGTPLLHTLSGEVGTTTSGYDVVVINFGSDPVQITSITQPSTDFTLPNLPTLPASIASGDTLIFHVTFAPQSPGTFSTIITMESDDTDRSPMTFKATGTGYQTGTIQLKANWNMVSLPIAVSNPSVGAVFPNAMGQTFYYQGNYYATSSLLSGVGYWVKYASAIDQELTGTSVNVDTIPVRKKWNMIGSVSTEIPTSSVFPIPPVDIVSSFYWYNPDSGYALSNTISPGKAYWVKTDTSGKLILNYTVASKYDARNGIDLNGLNSLRIQDATKQSQVLYFGNHDDKGIDMNRYELPPAPPVGTFDARFASNSVVALHSVDSKTNEFPIHIDATEYPVTIHWNVNSVGLSKYSLIVTDEKGKRSVSTMNGEGKFILTSANSHVKLQVDENILPTAFSLKQNYPNPFNPTTQIRYELPVDALIRLTIFDVLGREVTTLVNGEQKAGVYDAQLDASGFASGVYYYQLTAEPINASGNFSRFQSINKMLLMK